MSGKSVSRRFTAVLAALVLLFGVPLVPPAFSDHGNVGVYAVLDSRELLASANGSPDPATETNVFFEVFNASSGELVEQSGPVPGIGVANAFFHLDDGSYKIRAFADGFLESWFTVPSGREGKAFPELLGLQKRSTIDSADVILVDSVSPGNASWNMAGWTVLHSSASSISGGVASDSGGQAGTLLGGVAVELHDSAAVPGTAPLATTVTDASGYYTFENVPAGSYKVRFDDGASERWWPETTHRAEAEVITLDGANHFNLAYAVFPTSVAAETGRVLALSGEPALGATLTATPSGTLDAGSLGVDCLQRYSWFLDDDAVSGAFGPTYIVQPEASGKSVTARLDVVGIGCTYTALASNAVGPVDPSIILPGLTLPDEGVVVAHEDSAASIALTFDNVTSAGITTVTRLESEDTPAPGNFSSLTAPPLYYDIETTAGFDEDGVEICITFGTTNMTDEQAAGQHLYHYVDGAWVDITTSSSAGKVCGVTHSFSPFAIGQPHWPFQGFLEPVNNDGVLNVMKAGTAVPVKFSVGGDRGLNILAAGAPTSSAVPCLGATPDVVEQTVAAGASSLSYDAASDTYNYVWKTQKAWAGSCRQFVLGLDDGTVHTALFDFRK